MRLTAPAWIWSVMPACFSVPRIAIVRTDSIGYEALGAGLFLGVALPVFWRPIPYESRPPRRELGANGGMPAGALILRW